MHLGASSTYLMVVVILIVGVVAAIIVFQRNYRLEDTFRLQKYLLMFNLCILIETSVKFSGATWGIGTKRINNRSISGTSSQPSRTPWRILRNGCKARNID